jgi:hypothetical protein
MYEAVTMAETVVAGHGWNFDLASKKLLARCLYEYMLLGERQPGLSATEIAEIAEKAFRSRRLQSVVNCVAVVANDGDAEIAQIGAHETTPK